jgi:[ribosomal protein S5]-alanine N-acetyltransferase
VILKGSRLTLTALDADGVARARLTPDMQQTDGFFEARLREDPGARGYWVWLAALEDGTEVGFGGFGGRPGTDERLTLGYSVHEEHQGRGYATEIAELLTAWALEQHGVTVVRATIRPDNAMSLRVAEKAGFQPTGETVQDKDDGELLVFLRAR